MLAQYLELQTIVLAQGGQDPVSSQLQGSHLASHSLQQQCGRVEAHSTVGYLGSMQPHIC